MNTVQNHLLDQIKHPKLQFFSTNPANTQKSSFIANAKPNLYTIISTNTKAKPSKH